MMEGECMKDMAAHKEEGRQLIEPIKKLTETPGFDNFPEFKEVLVPLKELTKTPGFQELSAFKDILTPVKDLEFVDPIGKKANDNKDSKEEKKDDKKD